MVKKYDFKDEVYYINSDHIIQIFTRKHKMKYSPESGFHELEELKEPFVVIRLLGGEEVHIHNHTEQEVCYILTGTSL